MIWMTCPQLLRLSGRPERPHVCTFLRSGYGSCFGFLQPLPRPQHGIAAPRPPGLRGSLGGAGWVLLASHTQRVVQRHVTSRKSIGPAQSAHGNVLRSPVANAGQAFELLDGGQRVGGGVQVECATVYRMRHAQ